MPYTITDPEVERLARELAKMTGEPVDAALANAIRERIARAQATGHTVHVHHASGRITAVHMPSGQGRAVQPERGTVADIQRYVASLPVLDYRPADELLYDEYGLPL